MKRFKDTWKFSERAIYFEQHGVYTHSVPKTKPWYDFWREEKRRCIEGIEIDGIRITGYHYFYLNYFRIDRTVEVVEANRKVKKREFNRPLFYDGDYEFFWLCDIARYGITKEDYLKLELDVVIPDSSLSGGRMLVVLKARRKGYSYKIASMLARNYYHVARSKNFAFAYDKKFLQGDGIYQKVLDGISFNDENTAWAQPKLVDRANDMIVKSGYKKVIKGKQIESGFQSVVMGISLKDNPDGARGKAGELVIFEEMGKFPNLKKAWDITYHTVKQGTSALGLMIAFGTGGSEGSDFQAAEELFYEPDINDCLEVENQWDEGGLSTYCGYFVPIYRNLEGFIDEDGNSLVEEAIEYENKERDKKKGSKEGTSYSQYIAEMPLMPSEATLSVDMNIFPTADLVAQRNSIKVERRYNFGVPGVLYESESRIKFKPDPDLKPVYKFPHTKEDNLNGCVVIYEAPYRLADLSTPTDMYVLVHDPYGQDRSTTMESLGASYVIKRSNSFSDTFHDCIVASYIGRPPTQDDYNRNLFMLSEYYNAKVGFENDRGDVVGYARRHKKLHLLEETFKFMDNKELQGKSVRSYGMNMTENRKRQAEVYIRDWLITPITQFENGEKTLILHTIVDPALIEELIKFNHKGNFDRVSALMIGMYHLKEKFNKEVKITKSIKHDEFFSRQFYQ
jgi:hypothetical protein